ALNLDKKVEIKNLCSLDLYFRRIESHCVVKIPAKGKVRLSIAEIQAQVFDNNPMFVGVDSKGSHARIYIEDKDTRVLLGFEDESGSKQQVLDSDEVKRILELKTFNAFKIGRAHV